MKKFPIFITSADSYKDLWPYFFELFKKYWPQYDGVIYLNTSVESFSYEGLNIICTKVGNFSHFGQTFRAGLEMVESEVVLFMMIDFFFMGNVDNDLVIEYFNYFIEQDLDSLCFKEQVYDKVTPLNYKGLYTVVPPSKDMFSYQISIWKKKTLVEMVLPHEDPWLSEWYGTLRANSMKMKLVYTSNVVIPYLPQGALQKGKWVPIMIDFLTSIGVNIDYSKRGIFKSDNNSLYFRLQQRKKTFLPRLLSNIDLIKRKLSLVHG